TNGPMGPGELIKPGRIVAGVDRVAVDAYCATLLGFQGAEITAIKHASERKLGEIDLRKAGVLEVEI
ncbi:MAG TPA: cytoplasmic protein, partial [Candidatus Aminicenantes bacterium]|nr:cytoplasmic protein [Candidatus Aminicenantes bacterium]